MSDYSTRKIPQQSRSQQTLDTILDAGAFLFAQVGYETTTTNAIAEHAGIAIGTLYRYYPDKEAILKALAERYYAQQRALFDQVFVADMKYLPLEVLLDRLIDPFLALYQQYPAYAHILLGSDVSPDIAAASCNMEQELIQNTADFFRLIMPALTPERAYLLAVISKAVVKALIALIAASRDHHYQAQVTAEVKQMLLAHFREVFRTVGAMGTGES
jgi:AcrR family transcriptional regulator